MGFKGHEHIYRSEFLLLESETAGTLPEHPLWARPCLHYTSLQMTLGSGTIMPNAEVSSLTLLNA